MQNKWGCDYVRQIAPYVSGKPISEVVKEYGLKESEIVKLASNENPSGMSELAKQAVEKAMVNMARYPDANAHSLKQALSAHFELPTTWFTLGNGSNELLDILTHAFVSSKNSTVFSEYAFAVYNLVTQAVGARSIIVPTCQFAYDLEAMLEAISKDTSVIFIANPNNPTGTLIDAQKLKQFIDSVPSHIVVVLDEAYTEYLPAVCQYNSLEWVKQHSNLIVLRTFSKAYGLAGLRVGFAVAQPPLSDILNRIRQPFNVNVLAQAAAIAALKDQAFIKKTARLNEAGYHYLIAEFERLELEYVHSFANFVLVKLGESAEQTKNICHALLISGVIVRPMAEYGLPEWVRVSIGLPEENQKFIEMLQGILAEIQLLHH